MIAHLKQGTPRCRLLLKACSTSLISLVGSILQNDPLPGSSCDLGTLTKYLQHPVIDSHNTIGSHAVSHLLRLRLWRMEFCQPLSAVR